MNSFDSVMEKAYDQDMENKMKDALKRMRQIPKSENMKIAKSALSEARNLAKSGNNKEAKKKYQQCINSLNAVAKDLEQCYGVIFASGDYAGYNRNVIIASILTIVVSLGSFLLNYTKFNFSTKGLGMQIGLSSASLIGKYAFIHSMNKENKNNLSEFSEKIKADPEKEFKDILHDLNKLAQTVTKEMKDLK